MNIAEKLVKLRKEKGLTQEHLAQKLDISISSIRNYENIKKPREPKNDMLLKFAKFYNVSTEYLLNDEISNKTTDNITIENKLNLSDKTIEKIVEINTKVNNTILGKFIDYMSINDFWNKINEYKKLSIAYKEALPILNISKYENLLKKYSIDSSFNFDTIVDKQLCTKLTPKETAFFKNNNCKYISKDAERLLEILSFVENNKIVNEVVFENNSFVRYKYSFLYSNIIGTKKAIINNAKIPSNAITVLLYKPQHILNKLERDKEIIGFYLSKELNKFLSYLDNEEAE